MGKPTGLAKEQRRALDQLSAVPGINRFHLVGGSAVATHLHHRRSVDLDLFSVSPDVDLAAFAETARATVAHFEVISSSDVALKVRVGEVPVDFVRYPYAPLERLDLCDKREQLGVFVRRERLIPTRSPPNSRPEAEHKGKGPVSSRRARGA